MKYAVLLSLCLGACASGPKYVKHPLVTYPQPEAEVVAEVVVEAPKPRTISLKCDECQFSAETREIPNQFDVWMETGESLRRIQQQTGIRIKQHPLFK